MIAWTMIRPDRPGDLDRHPKLEISFVASRRLIITESTRTRGY